MNGWRPVVWNLDTTIQVYCQELSRDEDGKKWRSFLLHLLWKSALHYPALPSGTRGLPVLSSSLITLGEKFSFQKYYSNLERDFFSGSDISIMLRLRVFWLIWSLCDFSLPRDAIARWNELSSQIPVGNLTILLNNVKESLQMLPATQ